MYRQAEMRPGMDDQGRYASNETYGRTMAQGQQYGNRTAFDRLRNQSTMANTTPGMTPAHSGPAANRTPAGGTQTAAGGTQTAAGGIGTASPANRTGMGTSGTLGTSGDRAIEYGRAHQREDE
jgi:hypothetical protein